MGLGCLPFPSSTEFRATLIGSRFSLDLDGLDPPPLVEGVVIPEANCAPFTKLKEGDKSIEDLSIGVVNIGAGEEGNSVVESRRSNRLDAAVGVDGDEGLPFVVAVDKNLFPLPFD